MGHSTIERPLQPLPFHQSVNQTSSKGIASANPIQNLKIIKGDALKDLPAVISKRTPIVLVGGLGASRRRRYHLEIPKLATHASSHLAVTLTTMPRRSMR